MKKLPDTEDTIAALKNSLCEYEQLLDRSGASDDTNECCIDGLRALARAETEARKREVQCLEREVIRESEEAKLEAVRKVTPLFCSDIVGGLTSCCSTEKSWKFLLRNLSGFSKYFRHSRPTPRGTGAHRRPRR